MGHYRLRQLPGVGVALEVRVALCRYRVRLRGTLATIADLRLSAALTLPDPSRAPPFPGEGTSVDRGEGGDRILSTAMHVPVSELGPSLQVVLVDRYGDGTI